MIRKFASKPRKPPSQFSLSSPAPLLPFASPPPLSSPSPTASPPLLQTSTQEDRAQAARLAAAFTATLALLVWLATAGPLGAAAQVAALFLAACRALRAAAALAAGLTRGGWCAARRGERACRRLVAQGAGTDLGITAGDAVLGAARCGACVLSGGGFMAGCRLVCEYWPNW